MLRSNQVTKEYFTSRLSNQSGRKSKNKKFIRSFNPAQPPQLQNNKRRSNRPFDQPSNSSCHKQAARPPRSPSAKRLPPTEPPTFDSRSFNRARQACFGRHLVKNRAFPPQRVSRPAGVRLITQGRVCCPTMQFEYDPEKLIEEVKKRPGIWDFNSVDYRTKRTRQALWGEVVKEMNIGSTLVSKSDLRELGKCNNI